MSATSPYTPADHAYMARALQLAQSPGVLNTTTPNPRVGCVLVREGRIIGEGYTLPAGQNHAEIQALLAARGQHGEAAAAGATAYVTLEPCSHHGRTPPCADALIAAGVARVVAAMQDPNPQVAGQGLARLQAAGIETCCGLMAAEAREINIGFVARMTRGRPWLRLKLAASLDGRTALNNGASQWITGPASRADGHRWRARACAILTGIGTVLEDDPQLTVRLDEQEGRPRQPLKVIVDSRLATPPTARLFDGASPVLIACAGSTTDGQAAALRARGAEIVAVPGERGQVDLAALCGELAQRGINEIHAEAGHRLSGALLRAGLADELLLYYAPTLLGDSARGMFALGELTALADRRDLQMMDVRRLGDDIRILARPR
ncbi:fused diaminohydroxyphosphoribosylaminopyrimidine deaminase;5-amino-6-(5-phosphoribosylamino) uracil reductase [Sterolibacterium denitrificans]|uniref:Riboflavin biosynthesis protein RibD n=1 Tax=Sterolibacterium denitrificans TaxID=157592 RepID=A0A7Z7HQV9_9PROT|nr:bifunctional diaminohydroxyphosphoribosylaminopyrimidine deaminase/5-amino-6-(5-phosphoribosylamino)uracil reductase RibD [Sterolibacterium denitrificans]SMB23994.1 fused diaminohydroxyphosphoribosylaminopyrimidine deaminase;5-amino-6-(5-phosphoribosylamino) uracil reductase [Sterolibacterium denitrificans]